MTRNTFLKAAMLALPGSSAEADQQTPREDTVRLENDDHQISFNRKSGGIVSFHAKHAPAQEFVPVEAALPVFHIQYLDAEKAFRQLDSLAAQETSIEHSPEQVRMRFARIGGHDLHATVSVRIGAGRGPSYWSIAMENGAGLAITDVQFPFLVVSYDLKGTPGSEALIIPFWLGRLIPAPQPQDLEPDSPHAWQFRPENQATWHYPGLTMAQFLAYSNDRAGVLVRCLDTAGHIKQIKAVHHPKGIRLGISHAGDWPAPGTRHLEYEMAVQSFAGDWYDAAAIYRDWSLQQHWAKTPLHQRTDVPPWLLDSPPHIMIRMQGELDAGPCAPNAEFLPYTKLIPLLDRIATKVDSPVVAILMAWERGGPWVYPDCFPPVGGDEGIATFATAARKRNWHVGSYSNGTRWVTQQCWSGYDGTDYLKQNDGEKSICRTSEGQLWRELWDIAWRPSYACCLGVGQTHELAEAYTKRLAGWGLDWIQFLDQNVGCSAFPCYSGSHGHAPLPGKWMTDAMGRLLDQLEQIGRTAPAGPVAFSVESTPNEFFMTRFPVCDVRVNPQGHTGLLSGYVPLYHFLHHEFLLFQGGFGFGPEPYHLPIQTAYNFVLGEIGGGVLQGDGMLLNKDSINWAPWQPAIGNQEDAYELLRSATALRRGPGRPYVAFGRMEKPVKSFGVQTARWTFGAKANAIPAVFHAVWRGPDGRLAVALANWTLHDQSVTLGDDRITGKARLLTAGGGEAAMTLTSQSPLTVASRTCAILELS